MSESPLPSAPPKRKRRWISFFRALEHLALAVGACFGILAFVWQCQVQSAKDTEVIQPIFTVLTDDGGKSFFFRLVLSNIGERTVFFGPAYVAYKDPKISTDNYVDGFQYVTLKGTEAESAPVQPGASREFHSVRVTIQQFQEIVREDADGVFVEAATQRGQLIKLTGLGNFLRKTLVDAGKPGLPQRVWPFSFDPK